MKWRIFNVLLLGITGTFLVKALFLNGSELNYIGAMLSAIVFWVDSHIQTKKEKNNEKQ